LGTTNVTAELNPIRSALLLSAALQKKDSDSSHTLAQADKEVLANMGNLLSDSYLNSIAEFLDLHMNRENSRIVSTFGESIIDLILLSVHENSSHGLLIKTDFKIEQTEIGGKFVLLLTTTNIDTVLNKIKEKIG